MSVPPWLLRLQHEEEEGDEFAAPSDGAEVLAMSLLLSMTGRASSWRVNDSLTVHCEPGAATAEADQQDFTSTNTLAKLHDESLEQNLSDEKTRADFIRKTTKAGWSAAVHILDGIATPGFCASMVQGIDQHVAEKGGDSQNAFPTRWSTGKTHGPLDVPLHHVPTLYAKAVALVQTRIAPTFCQCFQLPPNSLIIDDLFAVRYRSSNTISNGSHSSSDPSAGGGSKGTSSDEGPTDSSLPLHQDQSHYSFTLLLNESSTDFTGGGTAFPHLDTHSRSSRSNSIRLSEKCGTRLANTSPVRVSQGDAVLHSGALFHRGEVVSRGTRYVLVGFLLDKRRTLPGLSPLETELSRRRRLHLGDYPDAGVLMACVEDSTGS